MPSGVSLTIETKVKKSLIVEINAITNNVILRDATFGNLDLESYEEYMDDNRSD